MPYWRSWGAALLRAGGAALLVPVGLLLVVAVASGIGGGGLDGLGQLTRGPELPGMSVAAAGSPAPLDGGLPAVPNRGRTRAATESAAPATRSGSGASGATRRSPAGGTPRGTGRSGSGSTTVTPQGGTPAPLKTATTTTTTSSPPPPVPRPRNPLRELVQTVQGAVAAVPTVGPPVADAVGSITDLLLLPPPAVPRHLP